MLPELSLLHRGGSASTEPRAFQTLPMPSAQRTAKGDVHPLVRAPRWSLLALEREATRRAAMGEVAGSSLAQRVLAPTALGAATMVGMVALAGVLVAVGMAAVVAMTLAVVVRLQVTRRWCERQRYAQLDHEAVRFKSQLTTKLRREHREELECLAMLVENVRDHESLRPDRGRTVSTLVSRLDALLLSYVDRAIEVRTVAAAFSVTLEDEPTLPQAVQNAEAGDPVADSERRRCFQILHLRTRAREMCRRRILRMERELTSIGQLVRLVHEQALASGLPHDELAGMLAEVLDEAEHARQAREEVEAVIAERHSCEPDAPVMTASRAAY